MGVGGVRRLPAEWLQECFLIICSAWMIWNMFFKLLRHVLTYRNSYWTSSVAMKKENSVVAGCGLPTARVTRARAAALRESGGTLPLKPPLTVLDKKQITGGNLKRAASDEDSLATTCGATFQQKKRVVLRDVSNICCENSYKNCINATRKQAKVSQRAKPGPFEGKLHIELEDSKLAPNISSRRALVQDEAKSKMAEVIQEVGTMLESQETTVSVNPENISLPALDVQSIRDGESTRNTAKFEDSFREEIIGHLKNDKNNFCVDPGGSTSSDYMDIDSDHANPQMCSHYAPEIYTNLRAAELLRRPCFDFMETLQRDITRSMRGILIDWLVEVSEEYKLVPDTLYLTVYIIDRFLSQNIIERQRLQLLGITCMLIASKYEEICAPRVDDFCFITDNTYSKGEVLKMESQVLNYLGFELSVPTIKTFIRRFLRAAQVSCKVPTLSLGYLANYLAELTLVEYSFLKFLPSVTAASTMFLARWTLDQSCHPWNATLQHYSSYKASDLKASVFALQDLQMNSQNCPLNAVRGKYKQQKFKSVAALTSPELLPSLFC